MDRKSFKYYDSQYVLDESGNIYSSRFPDKLLKVFKDRHGYSNIELYSYNHKRKISIHRLVYLVFNLNKTVLTNDICSFGVSENLQVNHIDGNKSNNHYSNLELVTAKDNIKHAIEHNLFPLKTKSIAIFKDGKFVDKVCTTRGVSKYIKEKFNVYISCGTISNKANNGKPILGFTFKYEV